MKKIILIFFFIINILAAKTIIVDENAICLLFFGCFNACESGNYITDNIADALNNAENGDVIKICPGTYNENNLNINKNITIEGLGTSPDDVNVSDRSKNPIFYTSGWRDGVKLENFLINQKRNNKTALLINGGTRFLFKNMKILSNGYGVVADSDINESNLTNVYINASKIAFSIQNSYDGLYLNNSIFVSSLPL